VSTIEQPGKKANPYTAIHSLVWNVLVPGGSHFQLHDCHKAVPAAAVANEEQEQQSCDYSVVAE